MKKITIKKKIMAIGAIVIITTPLIVAVSCGASNDADNEDIKKSISYMKNGLFVDSDDFQPIKEKSRINLEKFLKENRKLHEGEYVEVEDDIAVLADAYYSGKIQDISNIYQKVSPNAYNKMQYTTPFKYINGSAILPRRGEVDHKGKKISEWSANRPVIEMGANDSLIYFFDNDNSDGRSLYGFKKQFMFEDSSIMGTKMINEINKIIGLKAGNWGSISRVPFIGNRNKGVLSSYYGSQNNHSGPKKTSKVQTKEEWEEIQKHLKTIFPQKVAEKIIKYYKTASKAFIPTEVPFGYIKYEVIGPNAIKLDFSSKPLVTAAHFGTVSNNGSKTTWDAELSIGDKREWGAYNKDEVSAKSQKYLIIGKH